MGLKQEHQDVAAEEVKFCIGGDEEAKMSRSLSVLNRILANKILNQNMSFCSCMDCKQK